VQRYTVSWTCSVRCRYTRTLLKCQNWWEIPVVIMMPACLRRVSIAIFILIVISGCSASLPAAEAGRHAATTPVDRRPPLPEVTVEPARDVRASSGTRRGCRLMAQDPYLSNRVRQMSEDGDVHLIKYTLRFPGGSANITGSCLNAHEPSSMVRTLRFYKKIFEAMPPRD